MAINKKYPNVRLGIFYENFSGEYRIRTGHPLPARQVL